jgi:hypothetical protein
VVAHFLSKLQVKKSGNIFRKIDTNKSRRLSLDEIKQGLDTLGIYSIGMVIDRAYQLVKQMGNQSHYINKEDFKLFVRALRQLILYHQVFPHVDHSGYG